MLRDEDGELTPLVIKWAKTQDNAVGESIARTLEAVFEEIGIA